LEIKEVGMENEDELIETWYEKAQKIADRLGVGVAICLVDVGDTTAIRYYAEDDLDDPESQAFIRHVFDIVS
tara:strand:+ start:468 stop:683 length:216 start_codon:yes stop_codon:yes gene_type:complete